MDEEQGWSERKRHGMATPVEVDNELSSQENKNEEPLVSILECCLS